MLNIRIGAVKARNHTVRIEFDIHSRIITLATLNPDCLAGDIIIDLFLGKLNVSIN